MSVESLATPDQAGEHTYSYRPSLMGAPWTFRLTLAALQWEVGLRSGSVPYRDIRHVRLSYRPNSMHMHRFMAEVWTASGKLPIVSSSWKSMVEQENQDAAYSAFVRDLHHRLEMSGSAASFSTGSPWLLYVPGLAVFLAAVAAVGILMGEVLGSATGLATLLVAAFAALFLWQGGMFFYRNRPRTYTVAQPPSDLLPALTTVNPSRLPAASD